MVDKTVASADNKKTTTTIPDRNEEDDKSVKMVETDDISEIREFVRKTPTRANIKQLTDITSGKKEFVGFAMVKVSGPDGATNMPIEFEISAASISQAFARYDKTAERYVETLRKEIRSSVIQKASADALKVLDNEIKSPIEIARK